MALYKSIVRKVSIIPEKKTKQKDYLSAGQLPIIDQGQNLIGGYTEDSEMELHCNLPVIVFGDHTRAVKYIDFPFGAGADGIKVLEPTKGVSPKFLYYATQYLVLHLEDRGYARHYQYIEKKEVDIPPVSVQERIVARIEELFSELDSGVETLKTVNAQLKVYRQAVLKEAFSGKLTEEWRNSNPTENADQQLANIKSKNTVVGYYPPMESVDLPSIPASWMWVSIGDISKGAEYGSSQKSQNSGKVPVLRMGNIQNGKFDWSDLAYSSNEDEIKKYELHCGDVLFNRTNSSDLVGKTATYKGDYPAIFAGYLIRVNQIEDVDCDYLTYFLNSSIAKSYGNKVKTDGVNQSNINSKKLYSYPFPLCSAKEQKHVVEELEARLSVCDTIEQTVDTALQQAEALRQSILKKAFEGELL